MSIGKNIKKYRTQKGMTQRELAEAIGVSVQAISKWECGSTPDISQIIPLSSVLNVSPNELLDYMDEYSKVNDRWHNAWKEYGEGSMELIEYDREGLKKYPNDETFMFRLATDLKIHAELSENEAERVRYLELAEKQFLENLKRNPDHDVNREGLVSVYMSLGMRGEAMRYALESKRKDILLKMVYKDEDLIRHRQELIDKHFRALIEETLPYKDVEVWKIVKNMIISAFPDGNCQRYERYLYMLDFRIASRCEENGDYDGAVAVLREAVERCKIKKTEENKFTTPLFDRLPADRVLYEINGENKIMMIDKNLSAAEWLHRVMTGEYWEEANKTALAKREDYKTLIRELENIISK